MKFQCGKDLLEKSIAKVESIVPSRDTQTLLSHLLFTIEKDHIALTASDMESTVRITLLAENCEPGEITVRAKKISEIAKRLNSDDFIFQAEESDASGDDTSYVVRVRGSGKSSASYNMTGNSRSHFPGISHLSQNKLSPIDSNILSEMIVKTVYSISQEDNRYIYNGLCFIFDGSKLTIVGTDGRRLAAISRDLKVPVKNISVEGDVVVHARAIRQLQRLLDGGDEVFFGVEQRDIFFRVGEAELSSRLLEGKFPDYKKVIPQSLAIEFDINREELIKALSQVMVMTEPPSHQVRLTIENGQMKIVANTPDLGQAEIAIPIQYNGDTLEIGFNALYILDILKALTCTLVKLAFNDANKPIVVTDLQDPDFIALVMPMKI